jgi:hypothetical protein
MSDIVMKQFMVEVVQPFFEEKLPALEAEVDVLKRKVKALEKEAKKKKDK